MARAAPTAPGMWSTLPANREAAMVRTDEQLLQQFLAGSDEPAEAAFATLVERYGPIVHRVCLDVLGCSHEAQDAAQAVFLVLARKARSIRKPESLGPWLHGVAVRVARASDSAKRLAAERPNARKAEIMHERDTAKSGPETMDHAELHDEIDRLPEKYRQPIILCYLQGQTQTAGGADARLAAGNRSDSPASRPGAAAVKADTPGCRPDRSRQAADLTTSLALPPGMLGTRVDRDHRTRRRPVCRRQGNRRAGRAARDQAGRVGARRHARRLVEGRRADCDFTRSRLGWPVFDRALTGRQLALKLSHAESRPAPAPLMKPAAGDRDADSQGLGIDRRQERFVRRSGRSRSQEKPRDRRSELERASERANDRRRRPRTIGPLPTGAGPAIAGVARSITESGERSAGGPRKR